jgi:hypothetical protein
MKWASIFFSVIFIYPVIYFLLRVLELYDSKGPLISFGVDEKLISEMARPSEIFLAIYLTALVISVFFNLKKKYTVNTVFSSIMIVVYTFITFFHLI